MARAIGVSESSLKRWCDRGLLQFEKTAGGHRRLPFEEVVRFVREGDYSLKEPEVLGLAANAGQTQWTLTTARERLQHALVCGEEAVCRQLIVDLYLAHHSVSVICDHVLVPSFHAIGDLWECGDAEIYEERRACQMCGHLLFELRQMIGTPKVGSPVAMGATLDGDPYTLAASMAELVLRDAGWNAVSLGNALPFSTLRKALQKQQPVLFWLSISVIRDMDEFVSEMNQLFQLANQQKTAIVIGGRALDETVRTKIRYTAYCDAFQNLNDFSSTLL